MKSYRKELWFETTGRRAFLNITSQVEAALNESGVREGLVLVNAMHGGVRPIFQSASGCGRFGR
jgi:thiamine phosphate synthase YjbQ (UPF0047 family)